MQASTAQGEGEKVIVALLDRGTDDNSKHIVQYVNSLGDHALYFDKMGDFDAMYSLYLNG